MAQTIFERYGGFSTFSKVVSAFYDKILESPVTSRYFTNIDMRNLVDHQTKFVASVVGGPASYSNEHIARIHGPLKIDDDAFAEMSAKKSSTANTSSSRGNRTWASQHRPLTRPN